MTLDITRLSNNIGLWVKYYWRPLSFILYSVAVQHSILLFGRSATFYFIIQLQCNILFYYSVAVQHSILLFGRSATFYFIIRSQCNILFYYSVAVQHSILLFGRSATFYFIIRSQCNILWTKSEACGEDLNEGINQQPLYDYFQANNR